MQKDAIALRAEFQRAHFQEKPMPEYDDRLVLDFSLPVVGDPEARLAAMKAKPETVRVKEWRETQGLPKLHDEAGEKFLVPSVGGRAVRSLDDVESPLVA